MEPRQQDPEKTPQFRPEGQARPEQRKRRFRIVKLEERIAPKGHGHASWDTSGKLSVE